MYSQLTEFEGVSVLVWVLALALLVLASKAIRLVPSGERAVVTRFDGRSRVAGPGVVLALPLLERVAKVDVTPQQQFVRLTSVVTREGVRVDPYVTVDLRVKDPVLASDAQAVATVVQTATRRVITRHIAGESLASLAAAIGQPLDGIRAAIQEVVQDVGVAVDAVEIEYLDFDYPGDLARWAEQVHRSPRPRTRP